MPVALSEGQNGFFVEPEGGWNVQRRVYRAIYPQVYQQPPAVVQEQPVEPTVEAQLQPEVPVAEPEEVVQEEAG